MKSYELTDIIKFLHINSICIKMVYSTFFSLLSSSSMYIIIILALITFILINNNSRSQIRQTPPPHLSLILSTDRRKNESYCISFLTRFRKLVSEFVSQHTLRKAIEPTSAKNKKAQQKLNTLLTKTNIFKLIDNMLHKKA